MLEKEYTDIHGAGCLMHARQKFNYAVMLIRFKGMTLGVFCSLPKIKPLTLIDAINEVDKPLKTLPPAKRLSILSIRQSEVRRKVDKFFD